MRWSPQPRGLGQHWKNMRPRNPIWHAEFELKYENIGYAGVIWNNWRYFEEITENWSVWRFLFASANMSESMRQSYQHELRRPKTQRIDDWAVQCWLWVELPAETESGRSPTLFSFWGWGCCCWRILWHQEIQCQSHLETSYQPSQSTNLHGAIIECS